MNGHRRKLLLQLVLHRGDGLLPISVGVTWCRTPLGVTGAVHGKGRRRVLVGGGLRSWLDRRTLLNPRCLAVCLWLGITCDMLNTLLVPRHFTRAGSWWVRLRYAVGNAWHKFKVNGSCGVRSTLSIVSEHRCVKLPQYRAR